jgi:hypothetical protein
VVPAHASQRSAASDEDDLALLIASCCDHVGWIKWSGASSCVDEERCCGIVFPSSSTDADDKWLRFPEAVGWLGS